MDELDLPGRYRPYLWKMGVLAGEIDVGDVNRASRCRRAGPGQQGYASVRAGLIFTVAPASGDSPEQDRPVKLTTKVPAAQPGAGTWTASHPRTAVRPASLTSAL